MTPTGAKRLFRAVVPDGIYQWLAHHKRQVSMGRVRWGSLGRQTPIGTHWGHDRGQPIDRYYIERFLARHAADVQGRTLEVGDARYTRRFGASRVTRSDILHALPGNPEATFVGDIAHAVDIPSDAFDCVLFTQVLQYVFDVQAAVRQLHRILQPGGVALLTVPGIIKVDWGAMEQWPDCWRFTSRSVHRLFEQSFGPGNVRVESFGNVRAAVATLHGLAREDLRTADLDVHDPHYEVVIGVRAVKTRG
ncbi:MULTISPECIES: bifunctional 2-polyprenyl-6-hydroxyphenol methylase/3-demethylubiquinol 3-O-methyltransferase UbiG [Corallococcus]|uniref:class I SAM-dependent methyltransferase n=1 Tax=Corallococcus TaxID=83461 RepID=UPI0018F3E15D|nr:MULTISPECIES: methyltransferase domain-containing protein [Corallococcus]